MKPSTPTVVIAGLIVLVALQCVATLLMTATHNAQLKTQAEVFNAQLKTQTEIYNAQLAAQTERHNAQLMAQAAAFQKK